MATIRCRNGRYQVQIRCKGAPRGLSQTFSSRRAAECWARDTESAIRNGVYRQQPAVDDLAFSTLIDRFIDDLLPLRAASSQRSDACRLSAISRRVGDLPAAALDVDYWTALFRGRLVDEGVTAATAVKELRLLADVWHAAHHLWKHELPPSPFDAVRQNLKLLRLLVGADRQRTATISPAVEAKVRQRAPKSRTLAPYALLFAIETGMRRSEICQMQACNIDWRRHLYFIPRDKNDWRLAPDDTRCGRQVPLSRRARAILRLICAKRGVDRRSGGQIWPWRDPHSLSTAVRRLRSVVDDPQLRLHAARHSFCSREADAGSDPRLVAAATGHDDFTSLARYTHPDMVSYAADLTARTAPNRSIAIKASAGG
ncbi:MAG: site-specific integrase [Corallincola sp.]|nr:site-specific integrase [Corallincola sp.]